MIQCLSDALESAFPQWPGSVCGHDPGPPDGSVAEGVAAEPAVAVGEQLRRVAGDEIEQAIAGGNAPKNARNPTDSYPWGSKYA
jgi:hypothetical protein